MTYPRKRVIGTTLLTLMLGLALATSALAADAPGAHADGPPTLLAGPNKGLITAITTLIVFVCLVIVLGKFAWGPIAKGLKEREDKIRHDIADAEAARARADATLQEYNGKLAAAEDRIREMLSKATADGEKLATAIRMKAQQEAEEIKERASKDIEAARDAALREIYEKTADLATSVAEKIIRRNLNASDQQDLVRQSLEQLQTVR
jgi:F-type H+-transporting ATPase subunit b